jgi:hypothetical protein
MRHWKDFSGQPVGNAAHHATALAAEAKGGWSDTEKPSEAHETAGKKANTTATAIEEVTDRIFRRYAVH